MRRWRKIESVVRISSVHRKSLQLAALCNLCLDLGLFMGHWLISVTLAGELVAKRCIFTAEKHGRLLESDQSYSVDDGNVRASCLSVNIFE